MTWVVFISFTVSMAWADLNTTDGINTEAGFQCSNRIVISLNAKCNGVNDCGNWDDECECEGKIDSLCQWQPCLLDEKKIRRRQVCDGRFDCKDLSDECLCDRKTEENEITMEICDRMFRDDECCVGEILCESNAGIRRCINGSQICDGVHECAGGIDEEFCVENSILLRNEPLCRSPIFYNGSIKACACDGVPELPDFRDEINCSRYFSCSESDKSLFAIDGTTPTAFGDYPGLYIDWRRTFDGVQDCKLADDEWHHNFFYCFTNWTSTAGQECGKAVTDTEIESEQRNGLGSDCNHHPKRVLSSPLYLLKSRIFLALGWIMSIITLITNGIVIVKTAFSLGKNNVGVPWSKKANLTFVLNLAISDFLLGAFTFFSVIMTAVWGGQYWKFETLWKTTAMCDYVPFFILTLSEAGLLSLVFLTGFRLFTILRPYKKVAMRWIVTFAVSAWIIPLLIGTLHIFSAHKYEGAVMIPNLPAVDATVLESSQVQEIMRRILVLRRSYNSSSKSVDRKLLEKMSLKEMETTLTDINKKFGNWKLFKSVYSDTPICKPRVIVKVGEPGWELTFGIIPFEVACYIFTAVAYCIIVKKTTFTCCCFSCKQCKKHFNASNNVHQSTDGASVFVERQSPRVREDRHLQRKIFWIVLADCAAWTPVTVFNIVSLIGNGKKIHIRIAFTESFAIIAIQLKSAVNPFIYSRTVRQIGYYLIIHPIKCLLRISKPKKEIQIKTVTQ